VILELIILAQVVCRENLVNGFATLTTKCFILEPVRVFARLTAVKTIDLNGLVGNHSFALDCGPKITLADIVLV